MEEYLDKNVFKIIVVGNSGTGKTSFCNRWIKGTFSETYKATVMTDFSDKLYNKNNKEYKISLWDLAGQDKNIRTTKILTKGALGVLIFCDITNIKTRNDTLKWKEAIEESSKFLDTENNIPCFLIENKMDLVKEDIAKDISSLSEFSNDNNFCGFYRTSAKTGKNVGKIMDDVIEYILNKLEETTKKETIVEQRDSLFNLNTKKEEKKKEECC